MMGKVLVMARCQVILSQEYGCVLKVGVVAVCERRSPFVLRTTISFRPSFPCCSSVFVCWSAIIEFG